MNIDSLREHAASAIAWLKRLPRPISIFLIAFVALLLLAGVEAILRRRPATAAGAVTATTMAMATRAPAAVEPAIQTATAVPAPTEPVATAPLLAAAPTSAATPVNPVSPPEGLVAGHVRVQMEQKGQFGQFLTTSIVAADASVTSLVSASQARGTPEWREEISGWFRLAAPATLATFRVGGGLDSATATIDGAALGAAAMTSFSAPASETAAVALASGWHRFQIEVAGPGGSMSLPGMPIELAIGSGTTPPMPVTPYAVVAMPAPATSASVTSLPKTSTPARPTLPTSSAAPAKTPMGSSIKNLTGAKQ